MCLYSISIPSYIAMSCFYPVIIFLGSFYGIDAIQALEGIVSDEDENEDKDKHGDNACFVLLCF